MKDAKQTIRQLLRARRQDLSAAVVENAGRAVAARVRELPCYAHAGSIVAYIANENEIPTAPLLEHATGARWSLYLPRSGNGGQLVGWQPGEPLEPGRGGVLEPLGVPADPASPIVVLVPVVAWDQTGTRLGRGGGFYDRLFARLSPEITRVGLAYEFQEYPGLPRDRWDVPLHYVITERRTVRCGVGLLGEASLRKGGVQIQ